MSNRHNISIILLLIVLVVVVVAGFALIAPQMAENRRLTQQLEELQIELETLTKDLETVKRETEALKHGDPKAIERIARDKFGYSREGEDIYNVEKQNLAE